MRIKKVTVWNKYKKHNYVFNHIEDSWIDNNSPISKSKNQESWNNSRWKKSHCFMINGFVVKLGLK